MQCSSEWRLVSGGQEPSPAHTTHLSNSSWLPGWAAGGRSKTVQDNWLFIIVDQIASMVLSLKMDWQKHLLLISVGDAQDAAASPN